MLLSAFVFWHPSCKLYVSKDRIRCVDKYRDFDESFDALAMICPDDGEMLFPLTRFPAYG